MANACPVAVPTVPDCCLTAARPFTKVLMSGRCSRKAGLRRADGCSVLVGFHTGLPDRNHSTETRKEKICQKQNSINFFAMLIFPSSSGERIIFQNKASVFFIKGNIFLHKALPYPRRTRLSQEEVLKFSSAWNVSIIFHLWQPCLIHTHTHTRTQRIENHAESTPSCSAFCGAVFLQRATYILCVPKRRQISQSGHHLGMARLICVKSGSLESFHNISKKNIYEVHWLT